MTSVLFTLGRYYADELEAAGGRSLLGSKRGRPARNATASGATEAALAPPAFEGFECDGGQNHVKLLQRYTATSAHFPFLPCTPGPDCIGLSELGLGSVVSSQGQGSGSGAGAGPGPGQG